MISKLKGFWSQKCQLLILIFFYWFLIVNDHWNDRIIDWLQNNIVSWFLSFRTNPSQKHKGRRKPQYAAQAVRFRSPSHAWTSDTSTSDNSNWDYPITSWTVLPISTPIVIRVSWISFRYSAITVSTQGSTTTSLSIAVISMLLRRKSLFTVVYNRKWMSWLQS